ncbi:hypothetical protein HXX76_006163 [Chlamydomonas incerta]|uniref:Uncharacterized protein n=1 Tax=Chlamydomonas incerta TaxID=51695 RepID=A0A835TD48_CHLIN|nr:hypothetical protein HXX76_006163 [Chlamydomonas incerta]|eukprot:KAG2436635.1 hypothetical protein HXX76_006163 [Chlamydomonas incerta]
MLSRVAKGVNIGDPSTVAHAKGGTADSGAFGAGLVAKGVDIGNPGPNHERASLRSMSVTYARWIREKEKKEREEPEKDKKEKKDPCV